jgi:hypothetical protein
LAVFNVDSFTLMSPFSMIMRPILLLLIVLPAFISYRMGGRS